MRRSLSLLLVAGLVGCATSPPDPIQPKGEYRRINAPHPTDAARPIPPPVATRPLTPQDQLAVDLKAMEELHERIARDQALVTMSPLPPSAADLAASEELQARIARELASPPPPVLGAPVATLPPPVVPVVVTVAPPPAASVAVVAVSDYQGASPHPAKVSAVTESGSVSEPAKSETVYVYPDVLGASGRPVKLPASTGVIVIPDIVVEAPPPMPKVRLRVTPSKEMPKKKPAVVAVRSKPPFSLAKNTATRAHRPTPKNVPAMALGTESTGTVSTPIVSSRTDEMLLEGAK